MSFLQENIQILATIGSALAVYTFIRLGAKKESNEINNNLKKLEEKVDNINSRLSKLEGRFEERGNWESRNYIVSEQQKNRMANQ